jgi:hypothetical protein
MAYDPKEPPKPSGREPLPPGAPPPASGPVPFGREDLSDDDLHDIQQLLNQEQDVTRQDIQVQNFQTLIDRYTHAKKV